MQADHIDEGDDVGFGDGASVRLEMMRLGAVGQVGHFEVR